MAGAYYLRDNYLATQDAFLALLNERYLPEELRQSLTDGCWHYRSVPDFGKGSCSTQGSYILHFRYGDADSLRDMARVADVLAKNGMRFEISGIRHGEDRTLALMVPESDVRRVVRRDMEEKQ